VKGNNLEYVAVLRHLQRLHEIASLRNPDDLVGQLFPFRQRLRHWLMSRREMDVYRSQPFYYFLAARTRHYDAWYRSALEAGVRHVINVGCGSDTRAHRFRALIESNGARVTECDLPDAIAAKAVQAQRLGAVPYVEYVPVDLNDAAWPQFEAALHKVGGAPAAVMLEGVSPYVDEASFLRFLQLLAGALAPGSRLAYDYKIAGVADDFARTERVPHPFRLPLAEDEVRRFHEALGLRVDGIEPAWDLEARLLPDAVASGVELFRQDVLLTLTKA
jgi:methyltransferase (TIGR00027 family)